jgi:hypothetical protein
MPITGASLSSGERRKRSVVRIAEILEERQMDELMMAQSHA